jgi:hypothetical protein
VNTLAGTVGAVARGEEGFTPRNLLVGLSLALVCNFPASCTVIARHVPVKISNRPRVLATPTEGASVGDSASVFGDSWEFPLATFSDWACAGKKSPIWGFRGIDGARPIAS